MRALFPRLPLPLLLGLLALLPLALGAAAVDWQMRAAATATAARATRQLRLARQDLRALLAIDGLALADLRRPAPTGAAPFAAPPAGLAVPPLAGAAGGIVALFVSDPAGRVPMPGHGALSLAGRGFFRSLRSGGGLALGGACPLAPARTDGFVLALPIDPLRDRAFRGVVGACVLPTALLRAWRGRLRDGEGITVRHGARLLLRVGRAPSTANFPGAVGPGPIGLTLGFAAAPSGWPPGTVPLIAASVLAALLLVAGTRAVLLLRVRARASVEAATRFAEVLRLGAERHRQVYLGAPVALAALDPARRIMAANEALLSLLGYRREELVGQPVDLLLARADRAAADQDFARALAGDTLVPRVRRLRRRDGADVTAILLERIERGADGLVRRVHLALLEASVLGEAADPGRRDALARVVGGIAHDFNNLLMVLMGNLERLSGQAERPDVVRRLAGMALSAAERGATLTARLLAAAGTQPLRPELVNANRLLREAAREIEQAAGPRVAVQFVLSPVLDPVRLDPAGFHAVVLALVANAREAMGRGGRLTVETANRPGSGHIVIGFSDTGPGMSADVLARATEPFFTTRPPGRASGLGLSMADGFARQSGGWLELRSESGIGTTATLVLPRSEVVRETAPRPVTGAPAA